MFKAIKIGESSIRKNMRQQLGELRSDADKHGSIAGGDSSNKYPSTPFIKRRWTLGADEIALIGEIGTPFDMKETAMLGLAQGKKGGFEDYTQPSKVSFLTAFHRVHNADHVQAMDSVLNACGKFPLIDCTV